MLQTALFMRTMLSLMKEATPRVRKKYAREHLGDCFGTKREK